MKFKHKPEQACLVPPPLHSVLKRGFVFYFFQLDHELASGPGYWHSLHRGVVCRSREQRRERMASA